MQFVASTQFYGGPEFAILRLRVLHSTRLLLLFLAYNHEAKYPRFGCCSCRRGCPSPAGLQSPTKYCQHIARGTREILHEPMSPCPLSSRYRRSRNPRLPLCIILSFVFLFLLLLLLSFSFSFSFRSSPGFIGRFRRLQRTTTEYFAVARATLTHISIERRSCVYRTVISIVHAVNDLRGSNVPAYGFFLRFLRMDVLVLCCVLGLRESLNMRYATARVYVFRRFLSSKLLRIFLAWE